MQYKNYCNLASNCYFPNELSKQIVRKTLPTWLKKLNNIIVLTKESHLHIEYWELIQQC